MSRVLIACEESQEVALAFREQGIEAYSCDLQRCSGGRREYHIIGDVRELLDDDWAAIIAFPPCTHLAVSGAKHFTEKITDGRQEHAIQFFLSFTGLRCKRVAIENPVGIMSSIYRKPSQIIHPWMFGHRERKRTCLWLKRLPRLIPTRLVEPEVKIVYPSGRSNTYWYSRTGSTSAKMRSATFPGIARAMAEQWSRVIAGVPAAIPMTSCHPSANV